MRLLILLKISLKLFSQNYRIVELFVLVTMVDMLKKTIKNLFILFSPSYRFFLLQIYKYFKLHTDFVDTLFLCV